jgi:hypothetical protein
MDQPADAASAAWVHEPAFLMIRLNYNYFQSVDPELRAHACLGTARVYPVDAGQQVGSFRAVPPSFRPLISRSRADRVRARSGVGSQRDLHPLQSLPHFTKSPCAHVRVWLHLVPGWGAGIHTGSELYWHAKLTGCRYIACATQLGYLEHE